MREQWCFPSRGYVTFLIYSNDMARTTYSWERTSLDHGGTEHYSCLLWWPVIYGSTMRQTATCRPSAEIVDELQMSHSTTDSVYFFCCPNIITVDKCKLSVCNCRKYKRGLHYYCKQFLLLSTFTFLKTFLPTFLVFFHHVHIWFLF